MTFVCLVCKHISPSDDFYEDHRKVCPKCNNKVNKKIICKGRLIDFYKTMMEVYGDGDDEFSDDDVFDVLDQEFSR